MPGGEWPPGEPIALRYGQNSGIESSTYARFRERWRAVGLGRKIAEAPINICTDKIEDFR
jgi:hypothetical protein